VKVVYEYSMNSYNQRIFGGPCGASAQGGERLRSSLLPEFFAALFDLSERHLEARQLGFSRRQLGR
jgi:hypothetical protein